MPKLSEVLQGVKDSWKTIIIEEIKTPEFKEVLKYLGNSNLCPNVLDIFNAFKHFEFEDTNIVLLGQDPYHGSQMINGTEVLQANGLSFSVHEGIKLPSSLRNIYKEIGIESDNGDLTKWADQGVLLMNSALTTLKHKAGAHMKYWESITDRIIKTISDEHNGCVFLLLGNYAKNKMKLIDTTKHRVITGVHPSGLSANRGFFGSEVFDKVNDELIDLGKEPIKWN